MNPRLVVNARLLMNPRLFMNARASLLRWTFAISMACALVGCGADALLPGDAGGGGSVDGASDAGPGAGPDADAGSGPDARVDAGHDSGVDAGDAGGAGADAGPLDGGGADAYVPTYDGGTPILERATDPRADCTVARPTTDHRPRMWTRSSHALVTTSGGSTYLARVESEPDMPFDPAPSRFIVSTLGLDGAFGPAIEIPSTPENVAGTAAAPRGDGFLVVYSEGSLRSSVHDAAGQLVSAPRTLSSLPADGLTRVTLARSGDGSLYGAAYSAPTVNDRRKTMFVRIDSDGAQVGQSVELSVSRTPYDDPAPEVAATTAASGGWAVLWQETDDQRGRVYFAAIGANGEITTSKKAVFASEVEGITTGQLAFARPRLALVAIPDGWLAAWVQIDAGTDFSSGASSQVRVARLDLVGNSLAEAPVRAVVVDVDQVEPLLVPFRGMAAIFWSTGPHTYYCAGCTPLHRVEMVLIDPFALIPVSPVVMLPPEPSGLLGLSVTTKDDRDILIALEIGFHVHHEPGSSALRCVPR